MIEIERSTFEGQQLTGVEIVEDKLILTFGTNRLVFSDEGQSCCEYRHMSCDDELAYYVGSIFLGYEIRDGGSIGNDIDYHDQEFLLINTSVGTFTVVNHNEHNGYYGGFDVTLHHFRGAEQIKIGEH